MLTFSRLEASAAVQAMGAIATEPPSAALVRGESFVRIRPRLGTQAARIVVAVGIAACLLASLGATTVPAGRAAHGADKLPADLPAAVSMAPLIADIELPNTTNWGGTPLAQTTPPTNFAPYSVNFTSQVTGGAPPYRYVWNAGDGSGTGTSPSWNHTFEHPGGYIVTLTVTDGAGNSSVSHVSVAVYPPRSTQFFTGLEAGATTGAIGVGPLNVSYTFDPISYTPVAAHFSFGDGTYEDWTSSAGSGGQWTTHWHLYSSPGIYPFSATVEGYDPENHTFGNATSVVTVVVTNSSSPPWPRFFAASESACGPTVNWTFEASSIGGASPYGYFWSFGDEAPLGGGGTVTHAYPAATTPANFVVELVVVGANGQVGTTSLPFPGPPSVTSWCPITGPPVAAADYWEIGFWIAAGAAVACGLALTVGLANARSRPPP